MADILDELERLAGNVAEDLEDTITDTAKRWSALFGYTRDRAEDEIRRQRSDFARQGVSESYWDSIKDQKVADGYDKEAYEHELWRKSQDTGIKATQDEAQRKAAEDEDWCLVLGGQLSTADAVAEILGSLRNLHIMTGTSEQTSEAQSFILLDSSQKHALDSAAASRGIVPNCFKLSIAAKKLSQISRAPMLGLDTTLPQHRLDGPDVIARPAQTDVPVWYFFYGTLMEPERLAGLIGDQDTSDVEQKLLAAHVCGGRIRTWAGKYKALVDAPQTSIVGGKAFLVPTAEVEYALRMYETNAYEVVRCIIHTAEGSLPGCTFRFLQTAFLDDECGNF